MTTCTDSNCPQHGTLRVRGRTFIGTVLSDKMHKTVTVEWTRKVYLPKFERYAKRRTRIHAHNPPCLNVTEGELVKIQECRPLSKSKNFVVVKRLGLTRGYHLMKEARLEAKTPPKPEKVEEAP